jgi:hypothetical protein
MAEVNRRQAWSSKSPRSTSSYQGGDIAVELVDTWDVIREDDLAAILPQVVREVVRDVLREAIWHDPIDLDGGIELEDVARAMPTAVRGAVRHGVHAMIAEEVAVALRRHRQMR